MDARPRFRNHRGELLEAPSFAASEVKNAFGRVLDEAVRVGRVTITRHDQPRAVLLSMEEYAALTQARDSALPGLTEEFDRLLAQMQMPATRKGMQAGFDTSAPALGHAALAAGKAKTAKRKNGQTR